jgi:type II secretory pathway pseudopilin PulG
VPSSAHRRPPRQGGFSLIIVLILLVMLVGLALILLSTSRADLFGATNEREQTIAFYAAEAGIAHGKAYMSSIPYDPVNKWKAILGTSQTRSIDYVPGTNPPVTVPASYTVTFTNNTDMAPDAGGDMDGVIILTSTGLGPNNSRAVIQVATGIKDLLKAGTGYCAQANPPPSCRGQ